MCSLLAGSLLAFVGGMLIEEALAVNGILFFASSMLVKMALAVRHLEAMGRVLLQGVDCPLPIVPRRCEPHEEWPPCVVLAAAAWQPVGLCKGLSLASPCWEGDGQRQQGD